jgi:molecular chaperone DnaK
MKDAGDKVPESDKSALEAAIADLKSSIDANDAEAITTKTTALMQLSMKLGEQLYKGGGAGAEPHSGAPDNDHHDDKDPPRDEFDDVLDAEFTEVEEKNKKG